MAWGWCQRVSGGVGDDGGLLVWWGHVAGASMALMVCLKQLDSEWCSCGGPTPRHHQGLGPEKGGGDGG